MANRVGVEVVSGHVYEGVRRYQAQIGSDVDPSNLKQLATTVLKRAQECVYRKEFEDALNAFLHALAVLEKLPPSAQDGQCGIVIHNVGFCLHCLGEFEAAKAYYEQAITILERERADKPVMKKVMDGLWNPEQLVVAALFGSTQENRIRMTCGLPNRAICSVMTSGIARLCSKTRLVDIEFKRRPDLTMLDGFGRTRDIPDKSIGKEVREDLSSKWEHEGPVADGPSTPAWLAAARHEHPAGGRFDQVNAGIVPFSICDNARPTLRETRLLLCTLLFFHISVCHTWLLTCMLLIFSPTHL